MSRASFVHLLILAVFITVQAEDLDTIRFNRGQIRRGLDESFTVNFDTAFWPNVAVPVDFGQYTVNNNIVGPTDMLIIISVNETALTTECLDFKNYNVSNDPAIGTINYTSPFVEGINITTNPVMVNLTNNQWQLQSDALFLRNCEISAGYLSTTETYGWIGLGTEEKAFQNFASRPLFSILIDASTGAGSLNFYNDTGLSTADRLIYTFTATNNWEVDIDDITFYTSFGVQADLIFDLQIETIQIPEYNLKFLKQNLQNENGWVCTSTGTDCIYSGDIATIQDLVIGTSAGIDVKIPASFFMNGDKLDIKVFESLPSGGKEYIVLGWRFLTQYYTVFEQQLTNGPVIGLYKAPDSVATSTTSSSSIGAYTHAFLIIISIVVIIIVAAVVYLTFFKNKRITQHASAVRSTFGTELKGDLGKTNVDAANSLRL